MNRHRNVVLLTALITLSCCLFLAFIPSAKPQTVPQNMRIGIVSSLFTDVPAFRQRFLLIPMAELIKTQTGVPCNLSLVEDAFALGEQLEKNQVQLGVFHGFEYAWARAKYPKLKPLAITLNRHRYLKAFLVTRKDSGITKFAQMKGQSVALPYRSKAHCRLFMERFCATLDSTPETFFAKIQRDKHMLDSLNDVVRGRVAGIIVDAASLDDYKKVQSGAFRWLLKVEASPNFPAAAIVYREGRLSPATLNRFRSGLLTAHRNKKSQMLMTLTKLSGFGVPGREYQQALINIQKAYPAAATQDVNAQKEN